MVGYNYSVSRYFAFKREEWMALLVTAIFGGFIFSFRRWGAGSEVDVTAGLVNLILFSIITFLIMTLQTAVVKLAGVRFGVEVLYDKYVLGLLIGVFVSFLTFGVIPFFITGKYTYIPIDNLRVGRFRSKLVKNWEAGMISLSGILTTILLTVPFHLLELLTGLEFFHHLVVVSVLITIFSALPLPLIQTANPYTVYMSRLEALEGNTPGYDLFYASRLWYAFIVGLVICFAALALVFGPNSLAFLFSVILGLLAMFLYTRFRLHFA